METIRDRATEALPSVLLTLLSMIQALALELLWSHIRENQALFAFDWIAALSWLQIVTMLLGFLQIWLFYTSLVMRFRWTPSTRDSVVPFLIGILEFSMIDLLGPERMGLWFYTLGLAFAVLVWVSHGIFRQARRDPANSEFFDRVGPATMRDFATSGAAVGAIVAVGTVLLITGTTGWFAFAALGLAGGLLAREVHGMKLYWDQSVARPQGD